MPRKTATTRARAKTQSLKAEARIPLRIPNKPKINIVYLLGLLLIIASFLLGMLFAKVQYLEGNTETTTLNADDILGDTAATEPVDVEQGHLPILGNKDAKVTVIEFSDFQCPFCKSFFEEALPLIKRDYVDTGKIKFAYRQYPLTGIHPNAQKAAEASECANELGNFWGYHDELFKNQAEWESLSSDEALNKFAELANGIGLNGATLSECVTSGRYADEVKKDLDDGTTAGVDGTPSTFINGVKISGAAPYEDFKAEIEKQLSAN